MAIDLKDCIACVTGGGRGIGRATAEALAAKGARVVIGDLDLHLAEEVARGIGAGAMAVPLDVADPDSFAAFIAAAEQWGTVGLLVNNAGIMRTGVFAEQSPQMQQREIAINLGGVVTGMRLVLPGMLARNRGHIVNVASMAGKISVPGAAVYTATKFGVASLSRAVRAEIVKSKVSITTILPSAVSTELNAGLNVSGLPVASPEDVAREIVLSCRHGRPEVTVPRGLGLIGALEQGLPEKLGDFVKRVGGAQKRIAPGNEAAKAYQDRTSR